MNLLVALTLAAFLPDAVCTAELDRLLLRYREYGLLLPPTDACLVRFVSNAGRIGSPDGKRRVDPGAPWLGFSLDGRTVLDDFNEPSEVNSIAGVKPDPTTLVQSTELGDLVVAIQCHARGWTALSRAAYRRWLAREAELPVPDRTTAGNYLADLGWSLWISRLSFDPETPLSVVVKYLDRILPNLDPDVDVESTRDLVLALRLALAPRNSRPGSDEALIDDLIHITGSETSVRVVNDPGTNWYYEGAFRTNPHYQAVLRKGFAIVPSLLAHLDDERATRLVRNEFVLNNVFRTCHCRVKDVAWDVLCTLMDENLADDKADSRTRGEAARKWFAAAQMVGEEQYVVSRVLGPKDRPYLNAALFGLLCDKYPNRVPDAYRALIDHPERDFAEKSWRFARAIAEGPLPDQDKKRIFEYAARKPEPHHRAAGVKFLRPFDPRQARELLIDGLGRVTGRSRNGDMVLAELAAEQSDSREWQALAKAVRRADVGGRLELLKVIAEEPSPASRTRRLSFLAEYLTDDAVRDRASDREWYKWDNIAGSDFDRLQVRNFAAMELARVLKIDAEPDPDWSAAQWAALRERVRTAVAAGLAR